MKDDDKTNVALAVIWLVMFLVGLAFVGVVIWAVVRLVLHFTS